MRKIGLTALLIIAAAAGTMVYANTDSRADSHVPGSIDDPLVTKSYVDSLLAGGGTGGQGGAAGVRTEVVTVNPGEVLLGKQGAQFVVRAGKGVAYSADPNGISDVTDGKDIQNGEPVANNHLLIFPREGRGVMPDPKSNTRLTVFVIGGYEIATAPSTGGS
ncbi:MAG: hypothetical protein A9Z00_11955 [Thermobacillus sp. ZCTH02-B1]|uniref:hypothetical protein n=1 Tax=Thermobacillus sp. ZCTH02-B1 TaxID=1858795 RepID=UPI000B553CE1|nr:hypothetical protein [Thermobacillus sp. ZCTH02-B1]OUM94957.1 MAG: hypothetical protein A9Z00_11955 [Thermobacillus sp. ZCTH02-B1]